jgi:hypothetical protein
LEKNIKPPDLMGFDDILLHTHSNYSTLPVLSKGDGEIGRSILGEINRLWTYTNGSNRYHQIQKPDVSGKRLQDYRFLVPKVDLNNVFPCFFSPKANAVEDIRH